MLVVTNPDPPEPSSCCRRTSLNPVDKTKRNTLDVLLDKAFAPPITPDTTPKQILKELAGDDASAVHSEIEPPPRPDTPRGGSLDPVWEEVRQKKAKILARLPSKVRSLEGKAPEVVAPIASGSKLATAVPEKPKEEPKQQDRDGVDRKVSKKRNPM
ncbi:hypothetical protein K474DRAFT_480273 [Panus rudis PR-1116 ss-1]|nr:hypothetical protein K474DRAFT_480273 [Panus rudis PR-1116 ss-1]